MKAKLIVVGLILVVIAVAVFVVYNIKQEEPKGEALAKINDYVLTVEDFKDEMLHSPYTVSNMVNKEELLDLIVRREILIQEAQEQGLDKKKDFMRTIERYWKQTLVKELLEQKSEQLRKKMSDEQARKALEEWIKVLKDNAKVKIDEQALGKIEY